jgi:threonine dehydratase
MSTTPDLAAIRQAAERIAPYAHRTPVMTCETLNRMTGADLYFKCENFQKVGAFKFRGACNTVLSLSDAERAKGVATHSSGNHAAALALAAKLTGSSAHIVMPKTAPKVKVAAVEGYAGKITFCEPTLDARETTCQRIIDETGTTLVHPYNDYRIIAGQGTAALELLDEVGDLDYVLAPVGGGGLLSGTAIAVTELSPKTKVIAAEPKGADDAYRSIQAGRIIPSVNPNTIADGLLTSLGDKTFPIIRDRVCEIVTVDDSAILRAMRTVWERMKILIEPSAAVPVAALLDRKINPTGQRIGIILSGGNVDLDRLDWSATV